MVKRDHNESLFIDHWIDVSLSKNSKFSREDRRIHRSSRCQSSVNSRWQLRGTKPTSNLRKKEKRFEWKVSSQDYDKMVQISGTTSKLTGSSRGGKMAEEHDSDGIAKKFSRKKTRKSAAARRILAAAASISPMKTTTFTYLWENENGVLIISHGGGVENVSCHNRMIVHKRWITSRFVVRNEMLIEFIY